MKLFTILVGTMVALSATGFGSPISGDDENAPVEIVTVTATQPAPGDDNGAPVETVTVTATATATATNAPLKPVPTDFKAFCTRPHAYTWIIKAYVGPVDKIPGICGGLWDNLPRYLCPAWGYTDCSATEDGLLRWQFDSYIDCEPGDVGAAWWRQTKNEYGAISCPKRDYQ